MPAPAPNSTTIQASTAGRYWIDPDHTTITVAARHMFGLGRVDGTVALRAGEVVITEPISATRLQARLDATTFDTRNRSRDRSLRSARYLDTEAHPEICFHADAIADDGSVVAGTVIAHGAAAAAQLRVEQVEQFGNVLMVRAKARIDRYAHGVTAGRGIAGRWITVRIDATCYRMGDE
jgi:polyisoprenoid-binding protein YceI